MTYNLPKTFLDWLSVIFGVMAVWSTIFNGGLHMWDYIHTALLFVILDRLKS